jgi:hypothetical protein
MREFRTYGSVRGVPSNGHPYRDNRPVAASRVGEKQTFNNLMTGRYPRSRYRRSVRAIRQQAVGFGVILR